LSDLNATLSAERPEGDQTAPSGARLHLKLLSYNIQVGVATARYHHYLTQSWRHVLPHPATFTNLERIARMISDYDIVALQEVDAGSMRSYYVNQVEYLAVKARFPFWHHQTTRNLGRIAQHSNGLLSRIRPSEISEHRLPGRIPGRGVLEVRFGQKDNPVVVLVVHLALGKRSRGKQLDYITDIVQQHEHVVLMGDFNCPVHSDEIDLLLTRTHLCEPLDRLDTFPSWRPIRNIDHILTSPSLRIAEVRTLHHTFSDHLPIAVDIRVPDGVHLAA
jgi:endonuclease/exonuclease/phosphatase family metal-dependent hydrolase